MVKIWQPPSFDPPRLSEMPAPPPLPTVEEIEAIRSDAYVEAFAEGKSEGYKAGHAQGHAEGLEQGLKEGHERAYSEAREQIEQLNQALQTALEHLRDLPAAIEEPLAELAWTVGQRLSAHEGLARGPFVQAVQEALMRLPRPGETLFMRVREAEARAWKTLIDDPGLPFRCTLLLDADVLPGHAYVEVDGARLDLGAAARHALVRMALGLDLNSGEASGQRMQEEDLQDLAGGQGRDDWSGDDTGFQAPHGEVFDPPGPPARKPRAHRSTSAAAADAGAAAGEPRSAAAGQTARKAAGGAPGKAPRTAGKANAGATAEAAPDTVDRPAKRPRK